MKPLNEQSISPEYFCQFYFILIYVHKQVKYTTGGDTET